MAEMNTQMIQNTGVKGGWFINNYIMSYRPDILFFIMEAHPELKKPYGSIPNIDPEEV